MRHIARKGGLFSGLPGLGSEDSEDIRSLTQYMALAMRESEDTSHAGFETKSRFF